MCWSGADDGRVETLLALTAQGFKICGCVGRVRFLERGSERRASELSREGAYQFIGGSGDPSDFSYCEVESIFHDRTPCHHRHTTGDAVTI